MIPTMINQDLGTFPRVNHSVTDNRVAHNHDEAE